MLHADVDVELDVVDRNNKPPVWDANVYGPIHIKENVTVGTVVTSVKARFVCHDMTETRHVTCRAVPCSAKLPLVSFVFFLFLLLFSFSPKFLYFFFFFIFISSLFLSLEIRRLFRRLSLRFRPILFFFFFFVFTFVFTTCTLRFHCFCVLHLLAHLLLIRVRVSIITRYLFDLRLSSLCVHALIFPSLNVRSLSAISCTLYRG